jgi:hypothetical protein
MEYELFLYAPFMTWYLGRIYLTFAGTETARRLELVLQFCYKKTKNFLIIL